MLSTIRDADDGFDADIEIEKLLILIMRRTVSSEITPARKRSTLQNNTQIPPPVRFTRKNNYSARNSRAQAQLAMPSTGFHQPCSFQCVLSQMPPTSPVLLTTTRIMTRFMLLSCWMMITLILSLQWRRSIPWLTFRNFYVDRVAHTMKAPHSGRQRW
jgi:hypothetical protein